MNMKSSVYSAVAGSLILVCGVVIVAGQTPSADIYHVLRSPRVGGDGGFDYLSADVENRRLYVPRNGPMGRLTVWNLDTLDPIGEVAGVASGGAVADPKSGH